eukprot:406334_1
MHGSSSTKWIHLGNATYAHDPEGPNYITVPMGMDKNNYIIIDCKNKYDDEDESTEIISITKYNIDNNEWVTMSIDNLENISFWGTAFVDAKKQILFLFRDKYFTQIDLNTNHITPSTPYTISLSSNSESIMDNKSSFIIDNDSISQWNSEEKTLAQFTDITNKHNIYNEYNNGWIRNKDCVLLFGGYDRNTDCFVDSILEFNMKKKEWSKLPISLPKKMGSICCSKQSIINIFYYLVVVMVRIFVMIFI